jgi:hypothetical protein
MKSTNYEVPHYVVSSPNDKIYNRTNTKQGEQQYQNTAN